MGWDHIEGDIDVPYLTERESFRDVLLTGRLRDAIKKINLDDGGKPWLDDDRVNEVVSRLERITAPKLLEANKEAFDLIVQGIDVAGDPDKHDGREKNVAVIDFDHPERNNFLAINQLRVDVPGGKTFIAPDIVLFVNGIPLVVVECKSPKISNPMEEGINQILRYSNQRSEVEEDGGCERLFYYNQFLVSTFRQEARAATVGAGYEHYMEWKDTSPVPMSEVAKDLGKENLNSQEILIAGMLRKEHLPDIIKNYILFDQVEGRQIKLMCRYQQFRAVHKAIHRIRILNSFLIQNKWKPIKVSGIPADLQSANLDCGEKESIALALSKNAFLLMDEERGRDLARQNNLSVRGSLGVLIEANAKKLISADQLRFYFRQITSRKDIWINPDLCVRLLEEIFGPDPS